MHGKRLKTENSMNTKVSVWKCEESAKKKLHARQSACGIDGIHKIPLRLKGIVRYVLHWHAQQGTLTAYDEYFADRRHKKGLLFILFFFRARLDIGSSSLLSSSQWSRSEQRIDTFDQRQSACVRHSLQLLPFLALRCTRAYTCITSRCCASSEQKEGERERARRAETVWLCGKCIGMRFGNRKIKLIRPLHCAFVVDAFCASVTSSSIRTSERATEKCAVETMCTKNLPHRQHFSFVQTLNGLTFSA